jgi:hypothetical protein
MAQLLSSCSAPFEWNADIKNFIEDGRSILKLNGFTAEIDGSEKTSIPSGKEAVVTLHVANPRLLELACTVRCADESLFDSLPSLAVLSPNKIRFSFVPTLRAERKDLVFTVGLSSPELENTFPPETVVIHCNTPPGGVQSTLDTAVDGSGRSFAAFRLPASPTDDDLSMVRISYAPLLGGGAAKTTTLPVDDSSLLTVITPAAGGALLGSTNALNRYFQPSDIASGGIYLFSVAIIDSEGYESVVAEAMSAITVGATYTYPVSDGYLNWSVNGGNITVTSCGGSPTSIDIPDSIGGYPVTNLGDDAIRGCSSVTSITLPDTLESIGNHALYGCSSLISLVIPGRVSGISEGAIQNCVSLKTVVLPDSVTKIEGWAFYHCTALTAIDLPESVSSIGQYAFDGCASLATVDIPASVTDMYQFAFNNCPSLAVVHVRSPVPKTIQAGVFNSNAAGRTIYVPSTSVSAYKGTTNWSAYAASIEGE